MAWKGVSETHQLQVLNVARHEEFAHDRRARVRVCVCVRVRRESLLNGVRRGADVVSLAKEGQKEGRTWYLWLSKIDPLEWSSSKGVGGCSAPLDMAKSAACRTGERRERLTKTERK